MSHAARPTLKQAILPLAVFLAALAYFAEQLSTEPYFIDEGAYLAQTYYYRLLKEGRTNDVDWLHQASYDHLQFGRLLAGLALDVQGYSLPKSIEGMELWWGGDGRPAQNGPPEDLGRLRAARWPMAVGAAWGCSMTYLVASMLVGPFTGLIAALALAASPVYATHARRAMADDWVQAFLLAGFACSIALASLSASHPLRWFRWIAAAAFSGLFFGLAAATKLNGAVGILSVVSLAAIVLLLAFVSRQAAGPSVGSLTIWLMGAAIAAAASLVVFILIHPFFYARPELPSLETTSDGSVVMIDGSPRSREWIDREVRPIAQSSIGDRLRHMLRYRQRVIDRAARREIFPEASLTSVSFRAWAILNQGMGRWSAAARAGLRPNVAWILPLTLVGLGVAWCVGEGRRQWSEGRIPVAWMFVCWPLVETTALLRDLSLDWDRYYLGVVAWTSLLAALAIGGSAKSMARRMVLPPPDRTTPVPGIAHVR